MVVAEIGFDRYSLIVDGKRVMVQSGAMHYFRLPGESLWRDRLRKLKAGGYNTVDIYFNWDFHSKAPGKYDFTGPRDVKRLLDIIEEEGLYLIARPGPYINAETTRGGLPGWLLNEPGVILRNRVDGAFHYSEPYMKFVGEWFDHILPFLKGRENMLMIQVENEYSTLEMEPDYMEALIAMIRSHGITAPTMHNDFYAAGLYADVVDIYAIDNYSVTDFSTFDWRTFPELFSVMDHFEQEARGDFCADRPLMVAELQAGWFAGWKGVTYEAIHKSLGREHIGLITRSFLGQGGTLFNHYKAVGGTNWEHLGATDAYTSYDFAAPISEAGLLTERYFEAKRMNLLLKHFDMTATERVEPAVLGLEDVPSLYAVRQNRENPESYWVFTRNTALHPLSFELKPGVTVHTASLQSKMLPYNTPLQNDWQLLAINVEPLAQSRHTLIVSGDAEAVVELVPDKADLPVQAGDSVQALWGDDGVLRVQLMKPLAPDAWTLCTIGDYPVYFLGAEMIDRLWATEEGGFWVGPDLVLGPCQVFTHESRSCIYIAPDGRFVDHPSEAPQPVTLPELTDWEVLPGEFPVALDEGFYMLSVEGADMDRNHLHEGAAWYRYSFSGSAETLTIQAQHIWGVFLNGHPLIQQHTFHVHPDALSADDRVTLQLPQAYLNTHQTNTLLIYVESLGHHKGFHDDTRDPRGLLELALDGKPLETHGRIKPALLHYAPENPHLATMQPQAPIVHCRTEFHLNLSREMLSPLALAVDLAVERADIRLNGVLIGKYWQACRNQTRFYLPDSLLNPNGANTLELTFINLCPTLSMNRQFPSDFGRVELETMGVLSQLLPIVADTQTNQN